MIDEEDAGSLIAIGNTTGYFLAIAFAVEGVFEGIALGL